MFWHIAVCWRGVPESFGPDSLRRRRGRGRWLDYNSTENGNISASVIKMPGSGLNEKITLTLNCKNETEGFEKLCRADQTRIYNDVRPFIEKSLAR